MSLTQWPRRLSRKIKANHWVYLVLHLVLFLVGLLLVVYSNTLMKSDPLTSAIALSVGGSIMATAFVGWVLFLHVWLSQDEFRRMEILRKFGFIEAFEHRSMTIRHEYETRLKNANEGIDIMGFGLRALQEDYHKDFVKWANRATVRILLLDPEFPNSEFSVANQRDKEEGNDQGDIRRDVQAFLRSCSDLMRNKQPRFEIRLYRCLPSINMFRIDDDLFWGPYLIGDVSRNFPTFLVSRQGILYRRLQGHFDRIWSDETFSRAVPVQWLESNAPASGN